VTVQRDVLAELEAKVPRRRIGWRPGGRLAAALLLAAIPVGAVVRGLRAGLVDRLGQHLAEVPLRPLDRDVTIPLPVAVSLVC
jgi:hypothetical protein